MIIVQQIKEYKIVLEHIFTFFIYLKKHAFVSYANELCRKEDLRKLWTIFKLFLKNNFKYRFKGIETKTLIRQLEAFKQKEKHLCQNIVQFTIKELSKKNYQITSSTKNLAALNGYCFLPQKGYYNTIRRKINRQ